MLNIVHIQLYIGLWIVVWPITYLSHHCQNKLNTNHDFVELPDGGQVEVKSIRSMELSSDLIFDGVLHVPKFEVNLLSISKLTQALRCNETFYPDFYVVQDVSTNKMIGRGK